MPKVDHGINTIPTNAQRPSPTHLHTAIENRSERNCRNDWSLNRGLGYLRSTAAAWMRAVEEFLDVGPTIEIKVGPSIGSSAGI